MSRVEELWERLVRAALRRERTGEDVYGRPVGGIAGNVPSALAKNRDIDEILRVADEIQDDAPSVSRILCEHAYSLSQNLDPNSEGRGVLQFKTGLMSVIKQKLAKREVGTIDRSQDIARLQEFYKTYREKNNVDKLREEEMKLRESGAFSRNLGELERKTVKRKRVFATLKVLGTVLEQLSEEIPDELKRVMESDSALTEDLIAYNIIPLDAASSTNAIVSFPEVQAAVSALKYFGGLPELPRGYFIPPTRNAIMLDFLQYTFGFQKDNVANQHEHIIHLLANEQSRLGIPDKTEPKLDEAAAQKIFLKSLENYIKWCDYLCIQPVWSSLEAVTKEKKLLYVSLYFLIWGESSNIRFLPECLCYIFHHMAREMDEILRQQIAQTANSCTSENGVSFLDHVILPLYDIVAAEAANNDNGKAPHSSWRNYDDFNEYFWSLHCFELSWPWRKSSSFFQKPQPRSKKMLISGRSRHQGKTSFVEHRTFFHLYHSFHRLWIFLFMMFQGLTIVAFNDGNFNAKTLREVLSLGPTFVVMKFFESVLDIFMMYGAYSTTRRLAVSRIFLRFLWFSLTSVFVTFLYVKALQEESKRNSNSVIFRLYVIVIGIYAGVQFLISFLMRIPACHRLTNECDRWPFIRFVKWMRQERHYVGRGMYERSSDFIQYMLFWLVVLSGKFSFAYFLQIKPLVDPTREIIKESNIIYTWHDFVSKNNHNALTVVSVWAPVFFIYLLDIYVFYTIVSAVWGFLLGARARLGEIRSLEALHKLFEQFPGAFMDTLHIPLSNRSTLQSSVQVVEKNKVDAARFSPFWNEIIRNLREEDYITNFEMELLLMPKNSGDIPLVQWPLFLLASKIFLARDIAVDSKDTQDELWDRISRDDYMMYAVQECYYAIKLILTEVLDDAGRMWVERIYDDINASITKRSIHVDFRLNKLALVISRVTALMGILKETETPELERGAVRAVQDLYDVVRHDFISINMRDNYDTWSLLTKAREEGHLFQKLKWPNADLRVQIKRLYSLMTNKESASSIPKNLEARRRLEFFTNSLFMKMPRAKPVREMLSFSVFTPYYSEIVLYSMDELLKKNEDGISILFYLQKIFPDEWKNFLARIGRDENALDTDLFDSPSDILELRFWASYRGQTLARTVRGMMYYRKALMLQTYLESTTAGDLEAGDGFDEVTDTRGFDLSPEARAQVDLKFTYVVTCQIYGKQKEEQKPEAADIALLMQRNEALRVAFIDVVETLIDGKVNTEYYSKLVKADINGKDKEIYSVKLPGNPKLGEGKPENQNHAVIFTPQHFPLVAAVSQTAPNKMERRQPSPSPSPSPPKSPPQSPPARTILGKYQLTRFLGRGNFAKVYQARSLTDVDGASTVAVKVIDKSKTVDASMEPRIVREIDAMRRLQHHPNILKIHEVMATKTKIYLIVDFAGGGELFSKISRRGRLPEPLARRYFQQLVSALCFCHRNGVAHRDLKPQNLLLDADGNLKVSDFGLSALPEHLKNGLLHTACGTPAYTAPEILRRVGYDGSAADAWSCGVILYVLLAGHLPFDDSNIPAMCRRISRRDYQFPAWVSKPARHLIYQLLDPSPKTRIRLEDVYANSWFKKSLREEPEKSVFETVFESGSREKYCCDGYGLGMNAFDIISMSSGLDLSGLFETTPDKRREKRFTSSEELGVVEEKVKEVGRRLGFRVEIGKNGAIGLGKGKVTMVVEVFQIVPNLLLVALKLENGGLEFENLHWSDWKIGLQDVVLSWDSNESTLSL